MYQNTFHGVHTTNSFHKSDTIKTIRLGAVWLFTKADFRGYHCKCSYISPCEKQLLPLSIVYFEGMIDHRSYVNNLSSCEIKARDLCNTGVVLY